MKLSFVFTIALTMLGGQSAFAGMLRSSSASSSSTFEEDVVSDVVASTNDDPNKPDEVVQDVQIFVDNMMYVPEEAGRYLEALSNCFKETSAAILSRYVCVLLFK